MEKLYYSNLNCSQTTLKYYWMGGAPNSSTSIIRNMKFGKEAGIAKRWDETLCVVWETETKAGKIYLPAKKQQRLPATTWRFLPYSLQGDDGHAAVLVLYS